ncbi:MAG: ice-binding family protein [Nocardioides sp.]
MPVPLGAAGTYAVLAGTGVTNTGATVLTGDLGLSPSGAITGFGGPPDGTVVGVTHDKDAAASTAQADRLTAYNDAATRPGAVLFAGDQIGATFEAGLFRTTGVFLNTGTMTLDGGGNANAVFIFQVDAAYSPAAASSIVLTNGARASNVFWQVNGAVTIPAGSNYSGVFLVNGAATIGAGANLPGRVLVNGAVTLANNTLGAGDTTPPAVTIAGGPSVVTSDSTPTITGTTDEPSGTTVTVTLGSQTLTATVAVGGGWSVTAASLTSGNYTVTARVVDPAGNVGQATQALRVDLDAPVITITGGANATTGNPAQAIAGSTDEPVGSTVTVRVGGQVLTATTTAPIAPGGSVWQVTPTALRDGTYNVVAEITDPVGNRGTANQTLTVNTATPPPPPPPPPAPVRFIAIDGGSSRSTGDTTPTISGTTSEAVGSPVTITVGASQTLTATVISGGSWTATAATLAPGDYLVRASVVGGGVTYSATQLLTITGVVTPPPNPDPNPDPDPDPVPVRFVAIDGGDARTTKDATPTISGRTSEPVGSNVTVTVAGQNFVAAVLADGLWSITVADLPAGEHVVIASVVGGDGNTYSDAQTLTVVQKTTPPVNPPGSDPRYRPDAAVKLPGKAFVGVGIYGGAVGQQVTKTMRGKSDVTRFIVRIRNRGTVGDKIGIRGTARHTSFKVTYKRGAKDVSKAVKRGTFRTNRLAPGKGVRLTVTVTRTKTSRPGDRAVFRVQTGSTFAPKQAKRDVVRAAVRIPKAPPSAVTRPGVVAGD